MLGIVRAPIEVRDVSRSDGIALRTLALCDGLERVALLYRC